MRFHSYKLVFCAPIPTRPRTPDESFLYGPSRHVEHVWAKIPQFDRRLVGWVGAIEPPAHN